LRYGLVLRQMMLAGMLVAIGAPSAHAAARAASCAGGAIRPVPDGRVTAFNAIAVLSACDAWVAGGAVIGSASRPLIERWNGSAWHIVPSANPGRQRVPTAFTGVATAGPSVAWAIGVSAGPSNDHGFIERWDGTAWRHVPGGKPFKACDFNGIAVRSGSDAWIVGSYRVQHGLPGSRALIEHWNGHAWKFVPSPALPSSVLRSVSAVSATDAWAVGYYQRVPADPAPQSLIEHWNGKVWKVVPSPNFKDPHGNVGLNLLNGVTAVSRTDAWAVGAEPGHHDRTAVILHWNGRSWKRASAPSAGPSQLNGVAAASPSAVWAVGFRGALAETTQVLVERWNGHSWHAFVAPRTDARTHELDSVAASRTEVWAIGRIARQNSFSGGGVPVQIIVRRWQP
jgi:hypothetical protein